MRKDHLPKNWAWCRIDELVEATPKEARDDDMDVGFVPMKELGTKFHSQHGHEVKPWKQVKKGYTQFSDGDVLLARITPCFENGKAGIAQNLPNSKGAGSTEFFVLRPFQEAIVARLLLAYFKTTAFLEEGALAMTGAVGQQRVPKQFVLDRHLPLPPLNEQRRIADKLDTTLAAVEACKQKLNNAAETIQRFRKSVLVAAVSGELTREWREERHLSEPISTTLGEILKVSSGKFLRSKDMRKEGKIPVYGGNGINGYHDSGNTDGKQIIIGRVGYYCGSIHTTSGPAWITDNALITSFNRSEIQFDFLAYSLNAANLRQSDSSTAQPVISGAKIYPLKINLPSTHEEQNLIASILDEQLEKAKEVEDKIEAALIFIKKTEQSLLAKAFRGELVPQDPNDEPASVLLERIKVQREAEAAAKKPAKRGRKKKADAAQLVIPEGIAYNHLAKVLEECGALSERALLAASELEPGVFQLQLTKEIDAGGLKQVDVDGEAAYVDAAWEEEG